MARTLAVVALASVGWFGIQNQRMDTSVSVAAGGVEPLPTGPINRDQALQRVRSDTKEIGRLDRIDAKLTTPTEYAHAKNSPDANSETDATTKVWAVAVGGAISPLYAKRSDFTWAVLLFDAQTGRPLGMSAGTSSTNWPPFWDALADHSR